MSSGGQKSRASKYFWIYITLVVAMIAIVKVPTVENAMKTEYRLVETYLGEKGAAFVYDNSAKWYHTVAVEWDMYHTLEDMFIPTQEQMNRSKGMRGFGNYLFRYMHERLEAFWRGLYMLFSRMWLICLWLVFVPLTILPLLNNGWQIRNIKRTNFDYASPTKHTYAVSAVTALLFVLAFLILAPVPMIPLIYPLILIICGGFAAVSIANIQKRL